MRSELFFTLLVCALFGAHTTTALDILTDVDPSYVVKDGVVQKPWTLAISDKYVGAYESTTQFYLEPRNENFDPPTVEILEDDGSVMDVYLDGDAAVGYSFYYDGSTSTSFYSIASWELRVVVVCKAAGNRLLGITVPFGDAEEETMLKNATFYWEKHCGDGGGDGYRPGLFVVDSEWNEVVENGVPTSDWSGISPATEDSTEFYLWINGTYGTQTITEPTVTSADPSIVEARAVGTASVMNVLDEDLQDLMLLYTCHQQSKTPVELTITYKIPPFKDVVFSIKKVCAGQTPDNFNIGLDGPLDNVVKNGEVQSNWKAGSEDMVVVSKNVRGSDFIITMSDYYEAGFGRPIITASPGGVARPVIEGDAAHGGVADYVPSMLTVVYNCLKRNKEFVTLTVTIPMNNFEVIEFSWQKDCVKLEPETEAYWTANKALFGFSILLGLGMFALYQYISGRKPGVPKKYFKLPTTDGNN